MRIPDPPADTPLRDWVAVILAIGLCTAVNAVTLGVLYDAIRSQGPGLSENATQVLTGAFGGIIGILGAALGYRAGRDQATDVQGGTPNAPV